MICKVPWIIEIKLDKTCQAKWGKYAIFWGKEILDRDWKKIMYISVSLSGIENDIHTRVILRLRNILYNFA